MGRSIRGVAAGSLGLCLFYLLVDRASTDNGAAQVSGLFGWPAALARKLIDPSVPLVPDLSKTTTTGKGAAATTPATTPPATTPPAATAAPYLPDPTSVPPQLVTTT